MVSAVATVSFKQHQCKEVLGLFYVESSCSPRVCLGSLHQPQLPPTKGMNQGQDKCVSKCVWAGWRHVKGFDLMVQLTFGQS